MSSSSSAASTWAAGGAARAVFDLEGLGAHRVAQPLAVQADQPGFQRLKSVAKIRQGLVGGAVQPGGPARVGPAAAAKARPSSA